jgi:peptidyl-prolyl cis-trans isomerase SDCCAG10
MYPIFILIDTIYNMMRLQDGDVDEDTERPVYAHKVLRTNVITNPFPDIQPRETIQLLTEEEGTHNKKKSKSKMKATKDFNLISFGEEAEEEENDLEVVQKTYRNKSKSSHDLLNDPKLLSEVGKSQQLEHNKHELR